MSPIRTAQTTRYLTPLREGGSLPAIVEADDLGLYVMKFRGAGQGVRALIAEIIGGRLARALSLNVPEVVLLTLDAALARNEPHDEIRDLLKASLGLNLGLDYLPGSATFDPLAGPAPDARVASDIVWFDAYLTNVDRTAKNPNLLRWHQQLWLIDHGAALYFHHDWDGPVSRAATPFPAIRSHVLLPFATKLAESDARLRPLLSEAVLTDAVAAIPDEWLGAPAPFATPDEHRAAYLRYLKDRAAASRHFLEEAERAHAALV